MKAREPKLFPTGAELDPAGLDEAFRARGYLRLAGVDEAGRGPLAGPVVAAAVILPPSTTIEGVDDSKALSAAKRAQLAVSIRHVALSIGLGIVGPEEIDRLNILAASLLAMQKAVEGLNPMPDALLIDGPKGIPIPITQFPMVKADKRSQSVGAASIIAKVTRDLIMEEYHELYPQYGFHRHKGYATAEHLEALKRYGCCPIHRRSYRAVQQVLPRCGTSGLLSK